MIGLCGCEFEGINRNVSTVEAIALSERPAFIDRERACLAAPAPDVALEFGRSSHSLDLQCPKKIINYCPEMLIAE